MPDIERLHLTRRRLITLLPDSGARGVTSFAVPGTQPAIDDAGLDADTASRLAEVVSDSDTGAALFARDADVMLVVPPFPVEISSDYSELHTKPLVELLERKRCVGVFLLRLGGFSVGLLRDGYVVDSKTDRRFVKNRHRKGGQSQRRFERIREKQIHELFGKACAEAEDKFEPYRDEIEHVFLGGDRHTLRAFRKECGYLDGFGGRLRRRVLPVAGDPRRASLDVISHEIWASDVYRTSRRRRSD